MKKSILSGLIAGALTVGMGCAAAPASAEEAAGGAVQSYTLDDIVVTASRSETAISDVPADVTLISEEQIERGNYKSVSDALKGANINVVQKGFAAYPVINGDSRVLVMVDGKKVNWDHLVVSGDTNAVDVDQIAIGDVERIEIVRGPNSSLYGERAVSGVINIITKRPTAGKPTGSVNMQLGSWGEKRAGVNVSGGDGKNSIKVGVAHERRRDFQYKNAYGEKRTFQNSDIRHTEYNVGFDRILGNDRLRLEFSRHEADDGYGVFTSAIREQAPLSIRGARTAPIQATAQRICSAQRRRARVRSCASIGTNPQQTAALIHSTTTTCAATPSRGRSYGCSATRTC